MRFNDIYWHLMTSMLTTGTHSTMLCKWMLQNRPFLLMAANCHGRRVLLHLPRQARKIYNVINLLSQAPNFWQGAKCPAFGVWPSLLRRVRVWNQVEIWALGFFMQSTCCHWAMYFFRSRHIKFTDLGNPALCPNCRATIQRLTGEPSSKQDVPKRFSFVASCVDPSVNISMS